MSSHRLLWSIPVVIGIVAGCGSRQDDATYRSTNRLGGGTAADREDPAVRDDAGRSGDANRSADTEKRDVEALTFLVAVDEHEVQAASDALKKDVSAEVREFARSMQTDHGKHLEETRNVARQCGVTLTDPPSVAELKEKVAGERRSLAALQPEEFERRYVEQMVKDHEDVLSKIDEFIKTNPRIEVQTHLRASRGAIAHHLEMARKLQIENTKSETGTGTENPR